jgi:hypothetical protein
MVSCRDPADPLRWTHLAGQLGASPDLLREVLRDLARAPGPLTDHLTDDELGDLWELLNRSPVARPSAAGRPACRAALSAPGAVAAETMASAAVIPGPWPWRARISVRTVSAGRTGR